jgi:adenylate cyclase
MTTWFRGRPDAALGLAEEARRIAEGLAHPPSLLWASHVTAILHHFRGEPTAAAAVAAVAIRLATDLGLRQWIAWGVFFHGWLATIEGRLAEGLAAMQTGLDEYRATGAELGRVYFTATLAEAHGRAGQAPRALALLDESLALASARSERYFAAELHRIRAGLLAEPVAAEAELRRAVTLATQQGNRALGLRAATDLATMLGGAPGRRALAPLYGRFREGLDTADLRAARATLERLDAAPSPAAGAPVTSRRRRRS